jgi:hypothetical protein
MNLGFSPSAAFSDVSNQAQTLITPHSSFSGNQSAQFFIQPKPKNKRDREDDDSALNAPIPMVHQGRDHMNASPIEPRHMSFDRKRSFESIDSVYSFHTHSPTSSLYPVSNEDYGEEGEEEGGMNMDANEYNGNTTPYRQIKLDEFSNVKLPLNIQIQQAFYGRSEQDIFGVDLTPQVQHLQSYFGGRVFYLDNTLFKDFVGVSRPVQRYLFISYSDKSEGIELTRGNKCGKGI